MADMGDLESGQAFEKKDEEALDSPESLSESYSEQRRNENENTEPTTNDMPTEKQSPQQSVIVDWNGPDDPEFPQNWPRKKKFIITMTSATLNLCATFASSVFSAASIVTAKEFNVSNEVMILATSLFVLGFGVGPTLFGPLSELYGRKIPLLAGFFLFAIFQIPVAVATNIQSIMIFRFLQGVFGSSPTAILGGALADFWNARERGFAMPSFAGALFGGPVFGPIVGSFITESYLGWRWTQWITLIIAMAAFTANLLVFPETYAPVLLARRAKKLRHETGNWALHAKHEERQVDLKDIANRYLSRPAKMFVQEPILALLTFYLSFVFGCIYLFFEAYPISFVQQRGMSEGVGSLPFIALLIGVLLGCALLAFTTKTKLAPNPAEGRYQETRLLLMIAGGTALPIGLFWFAWTSFPSISPWPQIIASVPIGFAIIVITLQGLNYIIDTYTLVANSALAAMTFVRAWFGAGFPLFATYMFEGLGVPWATSVLAFAALAMVPVPVLFYKFGPAIRKKSKFVPTL